MNLTNGKVLIILGVTHVLLGVSPWAFGDQIADFSSSYFFEVSKGILEFPLFGGQFDFEVFAAFWFVYFGLLLIPLGVVVDHVEKSSGEVPRRFVWIYLIVILVGVYMIPLSGMTFLMLPHALYMLYTGRKKVE